MISKLLINIKISIIKVNPSISLISIESSKPSNRASVVQDYEIDQEDLIRYKKIMLTEAEVKEKHPSEFGIPKERLKLDYISKIKDNQFMLFNLPRSTKVE